MSYIVTDVHLPEDCDWPKHVREIKWISTLRTIIVHLLGFNYKININARRWKLVKLIVCVPRDYCSWFKYIVCNNLLNLHPALLVHVSRTPLELRRVRRLLYESPSELQKCSRCCCSGYITFHYAHVNFQLDCNDGYSRSHKIYCDRISFSAMQLLTGY